MPFDNRNINEDMSESFLNEFKERMSVDPLSESVRHINKNTSNKQAVIILVLIALAVCAGICWNLYSSYISSKTETVAIPVLKTKNEPFRTRPSEPGGMPVRDMDKTVYKHVAKYPATSEEPEKVIPQAARPVVPPAEYNKAINEPKVTSLRTDITDTPSSPVTVVKEPVIPARPVVTQTTTNSQKTLIKNQPIQTAPISSPKSNMVQSGKKVAEIAANAGKIAKASININKVTGNFQAQLISAKSHDAALRAWQTALNNNKNILLDVDYNIVETAIPGKGAYYRLRVGNFTSKEAASKFCATLKANGQDCIPVSN